MDTTAPAGPAPAYPLARPAEGADARFTLGLALDISQVLAAHGYPPITTGADLLRWQHALHTTIYHPSHHHTGSPNQQNKENS
jgi:hypothetical protein